MKLIQFSNLLDISSESYYTMKHIIGVTLLLGCMIYLSTAGFSKRTVEFMVELTGRCTPENGKTVYGTL